MLKKLQFKPGIVRDITKYTDEGGWFDADKVRFVDGFPEKIGGWAKRSADTFLGTCRSLHDWSAIDTEEYISLGTDQKFYIDRGGEYFDITPLRLTTDPMSADPLATTNGSKTVTVTDAAHGAEVGDYVTLSGLTGFASIPAGDFNQEHRILSVPTANTYTIQVATTATATTTGGGAGGKAEYQITITSTSSTGLGWGAGPWSRDGWGDPSSAGGASDANSVIWSVDNFGEDLAFNIRNNGVYYWTKSTGLTVRGVALEDLAGASDAPVIANGVLTSVNDRHLIAFGSNPIGTSIQDPLMVRWSDTEDAANWTPTELNTAGGQRLGSGSRIITAGRNRGEILIWTDFSLYSMQFEGGDLVYSFNLLSERVSIIGPNAFMAANNSMYWMDNRNFWVYDGRLQILPSPVVHFIFDDINTSAVDKIFACDQSVYNEVWWFYPSAGSSEPDRYVIYDYQEGSWSIGALDRTAWVHPEFSSFPVAAKNDGHLYTHEFGFDDDGSALPAYIETADFDIGDGQSLTFTRRVIPDVDFPASEPGDKYVNLTFSVRDFNTDAYREKLSAQRVDATTTQIWMRARGRQAKIKWASDATGFKWRIGSPRFELQPDGMR